MKQKTRFKDRLDRACGFYKDGRHAIMYIHDGNTDNRRGRHLPNASINIRILTFQKNQDSLLQQEIPKTSYGVSTNTPCATFIETITSTATTPTKILRVQDI